MKEIYESIKKSALRIKSAIEFSDTQYDTSKNKTGDTQLKLDILGDKIIEEEFRKIKSIKAIISEEKELQTPLCKEGKYIIAYDPIDGSSLIDVNLSVGSIFGIYENKIGGEYLKAAAYVVYGPRCELVIAEEKVTLYRLNEEREFTQIKQIKLKEKGNINASGATQKGWPSYHKKMIDDIFQDGYRLRYSGGMVPDLHQVLLKGGGLFSYPGTSDAPNGKLRKLFEVFPFAFIFEKAGGSAIDGKVRLLTLSSKNIHETTPCFFGSHEEIKRVKDVYAKQ